MNQDRSTTITNSQLKEGYKQTEVGIIPEDWEVKKLNELFSLKNGFAFSSNYFSDRGSILLTPGNFKLDGGLYFNERNTKYFNGEYSASMQLKYDELLIVMTDLTPDCNLLGKPAFVDIHDIILHNQRIGKIELKDKNISKQFLYWFFLSKPYANRMRETATGSTVRHTSTGSIYNTFIPLPSLTEQEAIASTLRDIDALIESLDRLLTKKRQIKQGAMQELLTGKKRLLGFSDEWQNVHLRDCLLSSPDYGINASGVPYSSNLPVYLRITDIDDYGRLIQNGMVSVNHPNVSEYMLNENEIVFARTGASVGKTYLYNIKDGKLIFAGFLIRARINTLILYPYFLAAYTKTSQYWNWVRMMSMRSGQPGINGNEYGSLNLYLPSLAEQIEIANILSDMDAEIDSIESKLAKNRQLKQGMMHELLTGRIRLV